MHTGAFKEHAFVQNTHKKNPKNILKIQKNKTSHYFLYKFYLNMSYIQSFFYVTLIS